MKLLLFREFLETDDTKFSDEEIINENPYTGNEIDKEMKSKIDSMSHEELARKWRHGSSSDDMLQGDNGSYFKWRLFDYYGGFNTTLSKRIGW